MPPYALSVVTSDCLRENNFNERVIFVHYLRLFFRVLSFLFLVLMIVTLVIDAARSVGASALVMTSSVSALSFVLKRSPQEVENFILDISASYGSSILDFANVCPAWSVFAVFSLFCYLIGYERRVSLQQSVYGERDG